MSELPRTDDLPRSDDGFDPARVEEAFASFAERVRELESLAVELRSELHELRAERLAERPSLPYGDEDWPAGGTYAGPGRAASPDWGMRPRSRRRVRSRCPARSGLPR